MTSDLADELRELFQSEEARYSYVESAQNAFIAAQIKALREDRQMSQQELADAIGTKQSGISRLENANYSSWRVETLRKLAHAYGVRLDITFREFGTLIPQIENLNRDLTPRKFEDDPAFKDTSKSEAEETAAPAPHVSDPVTALVPEVSDVLSAVAKEHADLGKAINLDYMGPILDSFKSQQESWRGAISGIADSMKPLWESIEAQQNSYREALARITTTWDLGVRSDAFSTLLSQKLSDLLNVEPDMTPAANKIVANPATPGTTESVSVSTPARGQVIYIDKPPRDASRSAKNRKPQSRKPQRQRIA
jgi:transcriptional regulator with XRE-family HTH domain